MVNAAGDETAKPIKVRGTLTAPAACGLQVCGHLTRILIERVIRLDKLVRDASTCVVVSYPIIYTWEGTVRSDNLGSHKTSEE
jgi:hypothetical protein